MHALQSKGRSFSLDIPRYVFFHLRMRDRITARIGGEEGRNKKEREREREREREKRSYDPFSGLNATSSMLRG